MRLPILASGGLYTFSIRPGAAKTALNVVLNPSLQICSILAIEWYQTTKIITFCTNLYHIGVRGLTAATGELPEFLVFLLYCLLCWPTPEEHKRSRSGASASTKP